MTPDVDLARRRRGPPPTCCCRCAADGLSGRALGDAGDAAAQHAILAVLTAERPDDVVFSEEAADDPRRLDADRVWIVDPLDGTREYGDPDRSRLGGARGPVVGRGAEGGGRRAARARRDPRHRAGPGAARAVPRAGPPRRQPHPPARRGRRRRRSARGASSSRSARPATRPLAVVRGEVDAYVHAGGMYQWDSAAPVAVARAAGLTTCRLDGSPAGLQRPRSLAA